MQATAIAKIVVGLIFLLIYIITKVAKASKSPSNLRQPPPRNPGQFQQPNNPFQPNPPQVPNPFQQQQQNFQQPNFTNPFQQQADAFSQPSTRNTNSNMGANSQSFYCMYCGKKFTNLQALQRDTCFKHPNSEIALQKHELYRGPGRPNVGF